MTDKSTPATITAFPKERIVRVPIPEAMKAQQVINHQSFLRSIITEEMNNMIMSLHMSGVDVTNPEFARNISFASQMVQAAVFRAAGLHHPLQIMMDEFFKELARTREDAIARGIMTAEEMETVTNESGLNFDPLNIDEEAFLDND